MNLWDIDMEQLIYVKDVDKSVLIAGFTIKAALLNQFIGCFGELKIGEKRSISISLNGMLCSEVMVINQPFNREKYPDHPEMYQVRYSANSEFARSLRFIFKDLWDYIEDQQSLQKEIKLLEGKKRNIRIPLEKRCQLAFYMGKDPNIWRAETIYPHEFKQIQSELSNHNISELEFEDWQKYDNASIKIKTSDIKIRILDKKIGG